MITAAKSTYDSARRDTAGNGALGRFGSSFGCGHAACGGVGNTQVTVWAHFVLLFRKVTGKLPDAH